MFERIFEIIKSEKFLLNHAWEKNGFRYEISHCIEELNELAVELSHYNRFENDVSRKLVVSEMADVFIFLTQIIDKLKLEDEIIDVLPISFNKFKQKI